MDKIKSRKFVIALLVSILTAIMPIVYKYFGVSDLVTLSTLAIQGSIAVGYGVINVKDAKNKLAAGLPQLPEQPKLEAVTEAQVG